MEFWIPYGETEIPAKIPDNNFYKILEPAKPGPGKDLAVAIKTSLDHPVDGISLREMVTPGSEVAIIADPSAVPFLDVFTSSLRAELSSLGVHSVTTFLRKRKTVPEQPSNPDSGIVTMDPGTGPFCEVGTTASGTPVSVHNELLAHGTRICLSSVAPHYAIGFTGGPETILPGATSIDTITRNRALVTRGLPPPGDWRGGLVLADTIEACKLFGATYNVCLVPDGWGGVDSVFSGSMEAAFDDATGRYARLHRPKIDRRSDIVMASAGPLLGRDLYHAVRVLMNVRDVVRKDGTIILVAECAGGVGNDTFLGLARKFEEKRELLSELRHHFQLGGQISLLLKEALERNRIELVSVLPDHHARSGFGLKPSRTASNAVQQAIRVEGRDAKILIVTRGDITVPSVPAS